jgi:2-keto-4-pentenoate hydratase
VSDGAISFADRLIDARRTGKLLEGIEFPATLQDAMAIQRSVADGLGEKLAGWKVAIHPEHGAVAAPLFNGVTRHAPTEWPWSEDLCLEVELAVRLKRDLPRAIYSRQTVVNAIHSASLGLELVKPRIAAGGSVPFTAFLADNLGNAGYVLGAARDGWIDRDLHGLSLLVRLQGQTLHHAAPVHPHGDVLSALLAYAGIQNEWLGGLRAGQLITTGSLCGLIRIPHAGNITVDLDPFGTISLELR